ncbi:putative ABC-2 type transporter protein [Spiroplasma syrphidicola EA-1]|uniref:Putative ABC-2 type transporter protein n=1 Tax=Spiroplasma syrphidicola EA-1 TaxID=1276229 RepID=R4UME3_9MOLU|nr:ABC transporter permease [Spiroplasma syrphidicola]AGM26406.1 putative ABC-2 type transporter protein [Spiroplasma syrphidicola EA-1]
MTTIKQNVDMMTENKKKDKKSNFNVKILPLFKLTFKMVFLGGPGILYVTIMPFCLLLLEGLVYINLPNVSQAETFSKLQQIIGAMALMPAISVGVFVVPFTLIEIKDSVLFKRIGATSVKPYMFIFTVISASVVMTTIGLFWTFLCGGLFYGWNYGWEVAFPQSFGISLLFMLIVLILSSAVGLLLASFFTSRAVLGAFSGLLFTPSLFFTGALIPIDYILAAPELKYLVYISPYWYCAKPFLDIFTTGNIVMTTQNIINLAVSCGLIVVCIGLTTYRWRWSK